MMFYLKYWSSIYWPKMGRKGICVTDPVNDPGRHRLPDCMRVVILFSTQLMDTVYGPCYPYFNVYI